MRDLLFLAHRIPFPPDKGDKVRAYNILRQLSRSHRVHLGCFVDDPGDMQHVAHLRELCASVFAVPLSQHRAMARGLYGLASGASLSEYFFRDPRMGAWVRKTVDTHPVSVAFIFCSAMAPYARSISATVPVIVDMVDVDSEKWRAYAELAPWPLSWLYGQEQKRLLSLERTTALSCRRALFVSRKEGDVFVDLVPEAAGTVGHVNNGVDLDYFSPWAGADSPFVERRKPIVLTGRMDYLPNADAAEWFARAVMPQVLRHHPDAEFWIVGANPGRRVKRLVKHPSVFVTGRVPDIRPYLQHAACVVAPLRIARGVQNKLLEAFAMAKPVVASPPAAEGLDILHQRHFLAAEGDQDFAHAVGHVLAGQWPELGREARAFVEREHDWSLNLAALDRLCADLTAIRAMPAAESLR